MHRPYRFRRVATAALLLASALPLVGCHTMTLDAAALEPHVYLTPRTSDDVRQVGRLEAEDRASWLFWGLLDLADADIGETIGNELARTGGTAVSGLEIRTHQTFVDGLLELLTLGIYSQRTVSLDGIIIDVGGGQ